MRFLNLLLALLVASLAHGACNGTVWHLIPAVMGQDGGVINVTAALVPGSGNAYVGVYPRVGVSTQESAEIAVGYAYAKAGIPKECDVLIGFDSGDGAGFIDGPSGGTALAVMSYALLTGRPMRQDTIITGAVDRRGNVGEVGGLYEKAKSSARAGARYFITPHESLYELLMLKRLAGSSGIIVLQADTVDEVAGFMFDNRSINQSGLSTEKRDIPEVAPYDGEGLPGFAAVAQRMIILENETAASVPASDADGLAVRDFFSNEAARQQAILDKGYVFSAANEAFLNYIDLSTIGAIMGGPPDLPRKKGAVGICISSMPRPNLTAVNFEWVVGADLRKAWAYDKLNRTATDSNILEDEKFVKYNELMYGDAWCNVAKALLNRSPQGGDAVNESVWKGLADRKLREARELNPKGEDTISRLDIALASYDKGLYGAAIYDASYVIAMEESDAEKGGDEGTMRLLAEPRSSLWARVYQSHAAFLLTQNQSDSAYRTAKLAKGLDNATAEMAAAMAQPANVTAGGNATGTAQPAAQAEETAGADTTLVGATILVFLLIIAIMLWLRRADGTHGKRAGRPYRAGKKKV